MVHHSTLAYLSSYTYHQPRSESPRTRKSAQIATPGSQNLSVEGQVGIALWRTCRVIDITRSAQNLQELENLPRSRPPGANTLPMSDEMDQIPATEALGCRWVPIRRLRKTSVIVVGHTYRLIYKYTYRNSYNINHQPARIHKSAPTPIFSNLAIPMASN